MITELIYNLSILISLSILSGFIHSKLKLNNSFDKIIQGVFFGLTAIIGMLNPLVFADGIIFDGRSVLISICTLFFGPLSGIIASLIAAAYRFYLGGAGAVVGLLVIFASFIIGWLFYNYNKNKTESAFTYSYFYKFGLLVHIVMLLLMLDLPTQFMGNTFKTLAAAVIIIFPLVTVLIGAILNNYKQNEIFVNKIIHNEKVFRTLFELSPSGILLEDLNGNIIDCNEAYSLMTGYSRDELIGKNIRIIVPQEFLADAEEHFNEIINGRQLNHDVTIVRKDGQRRQIDLHETLILLPDGNNGIIVVANDITERREIEHALITAEQKIRELLENTTNLFYSHSPDGVITYVSPQVKHFLGCEPQEAMVSWTNFTTDNPVNKYGMEATRRAIETGKVQAPYELELKKTNGDKIWVEVHEAPVVKDGKVISIVGTLTDITARKIAQDALIKSEASLKEAQKIAKMGDWEIDLINNYTRWSENTYYLYGLSHFKVLPSLDILKSIVHPHDIEIVERAYENVKRVKSAVVIEFRVVLPDQAIRWIHHEIIPVYENNKLISLKGVNIDITDHKLSEEQLAISERKYRHLFDNNPLPMWIYDINSLGFLEVNDAALTHYGYSKDEFLQMTILDLRPAEDVEQFIADFDTKKEREFVSVVRRYKKKSGQTIYVEITSHKLNYEGRQARLVLVNDITEKKTALEHAGTLSKAIEQSPASIFITDPAGKIEYVNPQFTKLTGYQLGEVIGKHPRVLKRGHTSDDDFANIWEAINSGNEWRGELFNKRKDGDFFWSNAVISPLFDQNGKIIHLLGVEEDITEKKKMIDELIEAKEKAEEMNRLKNNFLSNMSHELRTPLIGILGYTEMMLNEILNEEHREMAEVVHSSSKRLHETLNLILDLSRVESNKLEINFAPVDIEKLLNRLYILFYKAIDTTKIDFQLVNVLPGTFINSDERMLESIINNLLNNAGKFTESGSIILKAEMCSNGNNESIKISVIDTGIGIPHEKQEYIFSEFRQASEGFSRKFEGTGLGLTIAKKFTELLGGTLFVKSQPGKGSDFHFILPLKPVDVESEDIKERVSAKKQILPLNKQQILLVDDDPVLTDITRKYLKDVALIDSAGDGMTAIKKCASMKYDLVLLDIGLGSMDGIEVLKLLRKIKAYAQTPIIACTAFAMRSERDKFLSEGFSDYLSKPFTRQQLIDIIQKNLEPYSGIPNQN